MKGFCILRLSGGDVCLDFEDLVQVDPANKTWTVAKKGNTRYASMEEVVKGKRVRIAMHRLIMGFPELVVDHIDRNGLNNLRSNLRIVTKHQNWVNSGPRARGKSKYKGVSWHAQNERWRATIQVQRQWIQIGMFASEEDAARAYDDMALKLFGPTAFLNRSEFPI